MANLLVGQVGGLHEAALGAGGAVRGAARPAGDPALAAAVLPSQRAGVPMWGGWRRTRRGGRQGRGRGVERAGGEGALGLLR